jgi:hypothetical protein
VKIINKGPIMDTMERYHIHKAKQKGIQLNDKHTNSKKPNITLSYLAKSARSGILCEWLGRRKIASEYVPCLFRDKTSPTLFYA